MKILICPGFAKAGTTYIYSALRRNARFHTSARQELRFFMAADKITRKAYERCFRRDPLAKGDSAGEVIVEASPPYLSNGAPEVTNRVLNRIGRVAPEAKLLICLRHPVTRAYSRYLHLIDYFSRFGRGRYKPPENAADLFGSLFDMSFEDMLRRNPQVGLKLAPGLRACIEAVGAENILLFSLEEEGRRFPAFYSRLCAFMDIEDDGFYGDPAVLADVVDNSGGGVPSYHHGGASGAVVGDGVDLSPGQFLVSSSRGDVLIDNVDEDLVAAAMAARARWTLDVGEDRFAELSETWFKDDIDEVNALLARHFPGHGIPDYNARALSSKSLTDHVPAYPLKLDGEPLVT